jgi:hypothetical protein
MFQEFGSDPLLSRDPVQGKRGYGQYQSSYCLSRDDRRITGVDSKGFDVAFGWPDASSLLSSRPAFGVAASVVSSSR